MSIVFYEKQTTATSAGANMTMFDARVSTQPHVNVTLHPFTSTVKPQVTQSLLNLDSINRTLKCDHWLESHRVVLYCVAACFLILPSL